jgi:Na+-transporting methylmalonyl-CoA/oxaloacetate decarboxylase gamma subunit
MLTVIKTIVLALAGVAAIVGLWGAGVKDGKLTGQGIVLLVLILLGVAFSIVEAIVSAGIEKRNTHQQKKEKDVERHWDALEAQDILSLHVALFTRESLPASRLIDLLYKTHFDFGSTARLYLENTVRFPQLNPQLGDHGRPAAGWLWMLYEAKPGYWWKSTGHDWTDTNMLAAGFDVEILCSHVSLGGITSLGSLASVPRFGLILPWELVALGLEEVSIQFCTSTSLLDFDFSQHGLAGLAWLQHEQQRAVSQTPRLPLGLSISGQQILDELRSQFIHTTAKQNGTGPYRGIMGLSGPDGRDVSFFPSIPKHFMDSEASKEFSFRISVPSFK